MHVTDVTPHPFQKSKLIAYNFLHEGLLKTFSGLECHVRD
jgi:hypothetical protein